MESVKLENRPELPALESVEASLWGDMSLTKMRINRAVTVLLLLVIAGLLLYAAHLIIASVPEQGIDSYDYVRIVFIALFLTPIIFTAIYHAVRLFRSDIYWKTDSSGLTAYRIYGSRRLEWTEVTFVSTLKSSWGFVSHKIRSGRSIFLIPDGSEKRAHLAASVWQHLNRFGKAENITLQDESASFWEPIPDVVPFEMDLRITTLSPFLRILGWVVLTAFILAIPVAFVLSGLPWYIILFSIFSVVLPGKNITTIPYQAKRFSLHQYRFEAETGKETVRAAWSEVTDASWYEGMILLQTSSSKVYVPLTEEKESARLLLRIIERLRTIEHPKLLTISKQLKEKAISKY